MKMDRHRWGIVVAIAVVAAGASWLWLRNTEPRYQGKTVHEWIKIAGPRKTFRTNSPSVSYTVDYDPKDLQRVVKALGSNAAPILIQILNHTDSRMTQFKTAVVRTKWIPASIKSAASTSLNQSYETALMAGYGLRALGSNAAHVIPDLERIVCDPDKPIAAFSANGALFTFGSQALPVLRRMLTNAPPPRRQMVQITIQRIYEETLRSGNVQDREEAALALSGYPRPPFEIIHVLVDMLDSPDLTRQKQSLNALAVHLPSMAPVLIAARDALAKAAASKDADVSQQANMILADLKRFDSKQKP